MLRKHIRAARNLWTDRPRPRPLRKSESDFRSVFRRNPPTERVFGSEFVRRCPVVDCYVTEPRWLFDDLYCRCALRGQDCRLVVDGWLLSISALIATARTHFTNTSSLATVKGCSFPEKWLQVPAREPKRVICFQTQELMLGSQA
uniref:Uncharacterized protein n=1 Tax=Ananas comosus var. bracteatus TaxID=296719 RepID=A0A6V7NTJ1_ANACO|nr:unnamed protein product [Ananas comosus var. bracteatus]